MHLSTEAVVECLKSQDHIRSSDSRCGKDVKLFFKSFSLKYHVYLKRYFFQDK